MKFDLVGHSFKYEVEQIMLAFFAFEESVGIKSEIIRAGGEIICVSAVRAGGVAAGGEARIPSPAGERELKDLVKLSAFAAAKKISKASVPWGILSGVRPVKVAERLLETCDDPLKRLTGHYMVSPEKAKLIIRLAEKTKGILKGAYKNGASLYVGIPFCPTRCLYCSFVSYAMEQSGRFMAPYVNALKAELKAISGIFARSGQKLESVYIGGGTPTALPEPLLYEVLAALTGYFDFKGVREFCVEAGRADTITPQKLEIIKNFGASRICINPQSMDDETLSRIGRGHSAADVRAAFKMARAAGFDNINADIIAGLPGEDEESFQKTLFALGELAPEGMTVHTLYLKRSSRLKKEIGSFKIPAGDTAAKMLAMAQGAAAARGLAPYYLYRQKTTLDNLENTGYALPGRECLYNIYIMQERQTIFAAGAGGVTKLVGGGEIKRIFNFKNPDDYIKQIDKIIERKARL